MDALIVEDDYEFEMSFLKPPSPALKSLDADGRVIYVGSFSKSLFPGLRLGYLVGSEPFIKEARALRASVLRHPPGHIQRTAAYFLSLGHYDALVRRMGTAFHERREVMQKAIEDNGLQIAGPRGLWRIVLLDARTRECRHLRTCENSAIPRGFDRSRRVVLWRRTTPQTLLPPRVLIDSLKSDRQGDRTGCPSHSRSRSIWTYAERRFGPI